MRRHSRFKGDLQQVLKTYDMDGSAGDLIPGRLGSLGLEN